MLLAMWSGPRNISTAMMRSWAQRSDAWVIDEPFYAHYLKETGLDHPGSAEVIASQPDSWETVVSDITGPIPENRTLYYQKHITTHMLPHISLEWLSNVTSCFLIREPESVVASYSLCRPDTAADDLGYAQQLRIFQHVRKHCDESPLVIDSGTFLANPQSQLEQICTKLNLDFQSEMLSWQPGIRETDGVWHKYWYSSVSQSTGFRPYQKKVVTLSDEQKTIAAACRPAYDTMKEFALPG